MVSVGSFSPVSNVLRVDVERIKVADKNINTRYPGKSIYESFVLQLSET